MLTGKYLITGSPGVGKSSIIKALQKQGFTAYDTDSTPGATRFEDRQTGAEVAYPDPSLPIDWDHYDWRWQPSVIEQLLASNSLVFLGGKAAGQENFYTRFDAIFILHLDRTGLRHRILTRTEKDFGKHPDELKGILDYDAVFQSEVLAEPNAVAINASHDLHTVVANILSHVTDNTR